MRPAGAGRREKGAEPVADGSFRRVFRDEEHHREEYLDRQLEVGWEENPADRALEPANRISVDQLMEASDDVGTGLRPWRRQRPTSLGRRGASRAVSAIRRSRSGS